MCLGGAKNPHAMGAHEGCISAGIISSGALLTGDDTIVQQRHIATAAGSVTRDMQLCRILVDVTKSQPELL